MQWCAYQAVGMHNTPKRTWGKSHLTSANPRHGHGGCHGICKGSHSRPQLLPAARAVCAKHRKRKCHQTMQCPHPAHGPHAPQHVLGTCVRIDDTSTASSALTPAACSSCKTLICDMQHGRKSHRQRSPPSQYQNQRVAFHIQRMR